MRLHSWQSELEKLVISDSDHYREMVKELSWNLDNKKTSGIIATPTQVIKSLIREKEEREQNKKDSMGGRRDIGVFMYVHCHRIKELKCFPLFFNNEAGKTVHHARKEIARREELVKDMPSGALFIYLAVEEFNEDNPGTYKKLLNQSLGHID